MTLVEVSRRLSSSGCVCVCDVGNRALSMVPAMSSRSIKVILKIQIMSKYFVLLFCIPTQCHC